VQYFVFKLLLSCAECGARFPLEGPALTATCTSCHASIELVVQRWSAIFELYKDAQQFELTEGKTRGSALSAGEQQILIRWGPSQPHCVACNRALPVAAVPPGGDGKLSCGCGETVETFPPPDWLREAVPSLVQLFGAKREVAPPEAAPVAAAPAKRPVLFGCPRCGASLDISAELPRILTCSYCQSDLYLPDPLWHALHPIKKRTPFWVAFRD